MNAIPPTSALAGLAASTRGATPATVEHVAPEIARLSSGTILSGTVVSRDADGSVHIRTDHGGLVIRTPMRLPQGAEVKIQLQITGNQTRAVVLSVDPRPTPTTAPPPTASSAVDIAPSSAAPTRPSITPPTLGSSIPTTAPPLPVLRPGAIVTAQIIQPPPAQPVAGGATGAGVPPPGGPTASAGTPSNATSSDVLTLRVIDVVPAATSARPTAPVAVAPSTAPYPQGTVPGVSGGPSGTPTPSPPGPTAPPPAAPTDGSQPLPSTAATRPSVPAAVRDSQNPPLPSGRPTGPAPSTATGAGQPVPPGGVTTATTGGVSANASNTPAPQIVSGNVMAGAGEASTYLATTVGRLMIPAASTLPPNSIVRFEILPSTLR